MLKQQDKTDVIEEAALFHESVEKSNDWLRELSARLKWDDPRQVYRALRVTLHLLRDRLPVNEAVHLAGEFPLVLKGLYFENWRPAKVPNKDLDRKAFSEALQAAFPKLDFDPELVCLAVFGLVKKHISPGEAKDVGSNLPETLGYVWQKAK